MLYLTCALVVWATVVRGQDMNPCTTEDKPYARFFFPDAIMEKYPCAEFVAKDHCLCTMDAVRDACCASCAPHKSKLADCPCKDVMSDENNIEARLKVNNRTLDVINSCAKLVNKYGEWCVNYSGNEGLCCQSCQWLMGCGDDNSKFTNEKLKEIVECPGLIGIDHCHCANKEYKEICCHSCQFIDTSDCSCSDTMSPDDPAIVMNQKSTKQLETMASCKDLLAKYPQACDDPLVGSPSGCCCHSCQAIDTSCVDLVNNKLAITIKSGSKVVDVIKSCRYMKKNYPDLCHQYNRRGCCETCKKVDTSCLDTTLTTWVVDGESYDCANFIKLDPCNCDVVHEMCCKSCQKIRKKAKSIADCCADDPAYRMDNPRCQDCTCEEIGQKTARLVKGMCKKNVKDIQNHCCHTCRRAGVYVPSHK